jgi:NAD(P)-dependent dehydrogenase (short-subunit alcohol dehydrogenase family)
MKRIALVTGANRGLGLEASRQLVTKGYHVILTSRDEKKGKAAAEKLKQSGEVTFHPLDVTNEKSITALFNFVKTEFKRLDVLINNAGILPDTGNASTLQAKLETLRAAVETNTFGPFLMTQKFLPLMQQNNYGRIVNVSSGMGQLSEMEGGYPGYRISKTALNAVTKIFAAETEGSDILINSVCPGWVKTDMGGPGAERSVDKGAETIVWLATLPENSPNGLFFRDKEQIPW